MGYVKTYRNSKNLFDKSNADIYPSTNISTVQGYERWAVYDGVAKTVRIPCSVSTTYAISIDSEIEQTVFRILLINTKSVPVADNPIYGTLIVSSSDDNTAVFETLSDTKYMVIQISSAVFNDAIDTLMLCTGNVPYAYEAYDTTAWYDFCKKKTADGWTDSTAQKAPF